MSLASPGTMTYGIILYLTLSVQTLHLLRRFSRQLYASFESIGKDAPPSLSGKGITALGTQQPGFWNAP